MAARGNGCEGKRWAKRSCGRWQTCSNDRTHLATKQFSQAREAMDVQVLDMLPHGMTALGHGLSPERLDRCASRCLNNAAIYFSCDHQSIAMSRCSKHLTILYLSVQVWVRPKSHVEDQCRLAD